MAIAVSMNRVVNFPISHKFALDVRLRSSQSSERVFDRLSSLLNGRATVDGSASQKSKDVSEINVRGGQARDWLHEGRRAGGGVRCSPSL